MAKRRGQPSAPKSPPGPFRGTWTHNGQLLPKAKWLLRLLGGGALLMSAVAVSEELPVLLSGARAEARVAAIQEDGRDSYYARLEIPNVGPATTVRLSRYRRQIPLRVGQRVSVAYTSGTPTRAVPLNSSARWPGSLFFAGFGAFLLWLSRRR